MPTNSLYFMLEISQCSSTFIKFFNIIYEYTEQLSSQQLKTYYQIVTNDYMSKCDKNRKETICILIKAAY